MKVLLKKTLLTVLGLVICISCSDDEEDVPVVDSVPEFADIVSEISSLPGEQLTFEATVTDPAGIKAVNMKYEPWFLDKTIQKDSLPTSYNLSYNFKVPDSEEQNSTHVIPITITNAGNKTQTQDITVTLDRDNVSPSLTIADPIDGGTVLIGEGDEILLNISLADEELGLFTIESDLLNESVELTGTEFSYENSLDVTEPGNYTFTIAVTDASENTTSQTISVSVVEELMFQAMFLVDSNDPAAIDAALTGYPFAGTGSTEEGEAGLVFNFRYYAAEAGTEIYFIPQKSSFSPFTFGADPGNEGQLLLGSDNTAVPIILGAAGYYDIIIDLRDLTYTASVLTPPEPPVMDADFTGVYMTGTGLIVNGTAINAFNPAQSAPIQVDPENPFRYSGTVQFNAESGSFIFIGNQMSYSVFWRVNNGPITTSDAIVPQGGANCAFDTQYEGDYTFTVDLFLNTLEIIRQ